MSPDPKGRKKSKLHEYVEIVVTAVILALIVRALIIQSYHIPSGSMEDTLLKGDFLFANKFIYGAKVPFVNLRLPKVRDPKPGDIVIFKWPGDQKTDYIKRCIALEGQTVELKGTHLFIDGVEKPESYPKYIYGGRSDFGPYTVPKGHIFVFGDNRDDSSDSRYWGPLDKKLLRGKALFIYFSIDYNKHWIRFSRIGDIIR
ncbi:MAG: signal peptidase I [Candidatus Krumholzibacteriaceae bacterium]|jgi:signal peptidase I